MKSFRKLFVLTDLAILTVVMACLVCTNCGSGDSEAYDAQTEYLKACEDAETVTVEKVSNQLTAIVPENTNLIWENGVGSRVLVVSWVNQNVCTIYQCPTEGCQASDTCKEGKECQYGWDTYVTVVPEMKNFFKDTTANSLRIAQLLGLPPADEQNKVCFLELWVSPKDLFRPSPDPEISDHEAEIDFPGDNFSNSIRKYDLSEKFFADQACDPDPEQCPNCDQWGQCGFTDYRNYLKNRTKYIYTASAPYPWTRLGYTYDWGDAANHRGLSEFVVHGKKADGSKIAVGIKAVTPTAAYFRN